MICPRCNFDQAEGNFECVKCGVIFAEFRASRDIGRGSASAPRTALAVESKDRELSLERAFSGGGFVDLLLRGLGKAWPYPLASYVTEAEYAAIKSRNGWIVAAGEALSITGFILGALLPRMVGRSDFIAWDLAVQFGFGVLLPLLWFLAALLPLGGARQREFLAFYSIKYGVHWQALFLYLYLPILALGAYGAWQAYF